MHGRLGWDHTSLRPWLDPPAHSARLTLYAPCGNGRSAAPDDWSAIPMPRGPTLLRATAHRRSFCELLPTFDGLAALLL